MTHSESGRCKFRCFVYPIGIVSAVALAFLAGFLVRGIAIGNIIDGNNISVAFLFNDPVDPKDPKKVIEPNKLVLLNTETIIPEEIIPCATNSESDCFYTIKSNLWKLDKDKHIPDGITFFDRAGNPIDQSRIHNFQILIQADVNSKKKKVSCTWVWLNGIYDCYNI